MAILSSLHVKSKSTSGFYELPNPLRSIERLIQLNCWDLAEMDGFRLWQERERVKSALVFADADDPKWIYTGTGYVAVTDWLVRRLEAILAEEKRRLEAARGCGIL